MKASKKVRLTNTRTNKTFIKSAVLISALYFANSADLFAAPELRFRGNTLNVLSETPERSTGLDKIYIVYNTQNVDFIYTSPSASQVRIYKYSNLGGGYAEQVGSIVDGQDVIVENIEGNVGYIIEDSDKRYYYWIVNYLPYRFSINSVKGAAQQECDATILDIDGSASPIRYYTITGQPITLDREIKVEFDSQEWDESAMDFRTIPEVRYVASFSSQLRLSPPAYCSTFFHISGDRFLREWNWTAEAESEVIQPMAIMVNTRAEQDGVTDEYASRSARRKNVNIRRGIATRADGDSDAASGDASGASNDASNEITSGIEGLGGSAPAEIEFYAYTTEGVLHHEWQLSRDEEFEELEFRFYQQNVDYTFMDEGTYYMRYVGSNADGSCEAVGETYTITIGASELLCPNAFTPDGDGVNDEWKVSYRSITDFKCWIFDRFGAQLFYTDDPQKGWDGMRGGKVVPTGVYYYVIQATGADGKNYKKSGDINILRHRSVSSSESTTE